MSAATIVHDPSEAVALCPALGLYLKPITKMAISVSLPPLRQPGKSISNWEVMERLKAMAGARDAPFSALRIAKSTLDFIRFEGEVENRGLVRAALAALDGKTIKLSGFADALRVRAAEFRADFPSRHDWDSFFRDAADMNEALPGERPDTIHLEGLPCRWFAARETPPAPTSGTTSGSAPASGATSGPAPTSGAGSGVGPAPRLAPTSAPGPASVASSASGPERPSEAVLRQVFGAFGEIRHVDIPMLDPYREEMAGRSFHTFSFGGHLNFEAYVQYREYAGFARAMAALRGMKLMLKGDDGKAVACGIKVGMAWGWILGWAGPGTGSWGGRGLGWAGPGQDLWVGGATQTELGKAEPPMMSLAAVLGSGRGLWAALAAPGRRLDIRWAWSGRKGRGLTRRKGGRQS